MLISEAIAQLQAIKEKHGDLQIIGGYIHDDTPLRKIIVLDNNSCEIQPSQEDNLVKPIVAGVFLES